MLHFSKKLSVKEAGSREGPQAPTVWKIHFAALFVIQNIESRGKNSFRCTFYSRKIHFAALFVNPNDELTKSAAK